MSLKIKKDLNGQSVYSALSVLVFTMKETAIFLDSVHLLVYTEKEISRRRNRDKGDRRWV